MQPHDISPGRLEPELERLRAELEAERERSRARLEDLNRTLGRRAAELKATLDHHARELASMARIHEVSMRLVRMNDLSLIYQEILEAAIGITVADKGTVQIPDAAGNFRIIAQSGFEQSDIEPLNDAQIALAGEALHRGERLVIDVARSARGRSAPAEVFQATGVRSLQLTPLSGRGGDLAGIVATHYTTRRHPEDYGLRLLDMLARQATEIILRRRAEAALREHEAAMRAFFEKSKVGATQLDLDGRFVYVNDRYCQVTGYSREELLGGMTPIGLTPPEYRAAVAEALLPFMRGEVPEYNIEHPYTRKDGKEIWVQVTANLIRDDHGRPQAVAGIVQDISERKTVEQELISIAQFPDENPHPVLRVAFDGGILYANHAADVLMNELGREGGTDAPVEIRAIVDEARRHPPDNEIEIHYGKGRTVGFICVAIAEKGYVNLYGRDTTERRRAEEELKQSRRELELINQTLEQRVAERTAEAEARTVQLRKLAAELTRTEQRERRRFAQMLHDHLQQLLVGAKFNASILSRRITDPNATRHLQYVTDLLDQSIAASRSLTVELSPPILFEGKLVPALHWLARWMLENHGLRLDITADEEIHPISEDMRILLFQCVRELAFNIVKHAGVNEAAVIVCHLDSEVQITVEDKGDGFDSAKLKFDAGGFGLLNIQERLILHGGRLDIVSSPGSGARMTIFAPIQPARLTTTATPEHAAIEEIEKTAQSTDNRIRILIADDHAVIRDGLSQVLQSDPELEVVGTAADGQEAIDMTNRLHPDVVLMDVSMPRISGIEATRQLRRNNMHVSIIGLSMHSETDMAARMREAGAADYLVKTAPPDEVIAAIRHAHQR